jgi:pimeloyl-ACP methyl ester carboxylesterase
VTPPGARDVFVEANGLRLHLLDWGGEGQPILCIHATGFLAALWHPVAVTLAARARVLGLDLGPALLVGHSVGGAAAALCAARYPHLVRGLVLVDPVILPEATYKHAETAEDSDLYRGAGRRRQAWPSREAMRQSLGRKLPFARWRPEIFDLYVQHAVRSTSDGQVTLKCSPETEGAIYRETLRFNLWPEIVRARVPTLVLRGLSEHGLPSTTTRNLAHLLPTAEDWPVESASHLIPMEEPEEVTAAVQVLLDRLAPESDG